MAMLGNRSVETLWTKIKAGFERLRAARDGVSVVEFAMIMPLMITLYLGAFECSQALTIDRRVTAVSSAAADLVAQAESVDNSEIDDIFQAATSIMSPYDASSVVITVTSVVADADNDTTVEWSRSKNGTAYATGSNFSLPNGLTTPYSSVIVAEVAYTYTPVIGQVLAGSITLRETFYLRPRRSQKVINTDA